MGARRTDATAPIDYRGLLPIYVSAIFAYWLDSSYKGLALVDLSRMVDWEPGRSTISPGGWMRANLSALTGSSVAGSIAPLYQPHVAQCAVHVAHSASLVPCFLVALLLLTDNRLVHGRRVIGLASVLYVASLTYQYQWIIVPCLLSLAVVERNRWTWSLSIVAATILFVAMTFLTYQALAAVGLSVQSHFNDPVAVIRGRLTLAMESDVSALVRSSLETVELLVRAYHPVLVVLSILGSIFAHARLRILVCAGTVLGLASGYFGPVTWVAMNGYPFLYLSAGLALVQGPRWLAATVAGFGSSRWPQAAARIASGSRVLAGLGTVVLLLLAMWSTNGDLFGDYSFAQAWWSYTHRVH